jgi:hypothetical protein
MIQPPLFHQFIMTAHFGYIAAVDVEDFAAIPYGGQTVGYNE